MTDPFRPPPPIPPGQPLGAAQRDPAVPPVSQPRSRRRGVVTAGAVGAALVVVLGLVGWLVGSSVSDQQAPSASVSESVSAPATSSATTPNPSSPNSAAPAPEYAAAWAQLMALPVKGRAPKTGYSRSQFGQAWSDDVDVAGGHNGCDTRNDILRRDLTDVVVKPRTRDCVVLSGTLHDPYTGTTVAFTRGAQTSAAVQIDHVVALSDAWQKGAQQLTARQRTDLANDPRNLQATIGSVNQRKGAGDAATWLPPNRAFRCTYAQRQIAVKSIYKLWVTAAERNALVTQLRSCSSASPH